MLSRSRSASFICCSYNITPSPHPQTIPQVTYPPFFLSPPLPHLSCAAPCHKYALLSRVRELGLLEKTAELGILSKLEKQGLTLQKAEQLLPLLEDLGLLGLVANNQQLLINGVAPLAVEGAPLLLPLVAGALDVGAPAFYLAAASLAGLDAFLFASGAEIPFLGLSAGAVAGVLLVPLSAVLVVVGGALGNLKN